MANTETVNAARDVQRVEARSRATAEMTEADRELNAAALETAADDGDTGGEPAPRAPVSLPDPAPEPRRPAPIMSDHDRRRMEIIKSFREDRNQRDTEAEADDDEIRNMSNAGLPPELTEAVDQRDDVDDEERRPPPVSAQPEPDLAPAEDRKHKLIVRGKEVYLSDAELLEHAQKSVAHDDYVADGRSVLDRAKELEGRLNAALSQVPGTRQPAGTHPAGEEAQQTEQPPREPGAPPANAFREAAGQVVDALQFGDRDAAVDKMVDFMTKQVPTITTAEVRAQRITEEYNSSMKALKDFTEQHQDIAKDDMAAASFQAAVIKLQREDLEKLGRTEAQLADPNYVAAEHLKARAARMDTRNPKDLLDHALVAFNKRWNITDPAPKPATDPARQGTPPGQQQQTTDAQPQPQQQRRVEVSLNREQRRAAIPQQPERTVAPRPNPTRPEEAKPKDRSDVVKAMQDKRAALRGRVTA